MSSATPLIQLRNISKAFSGREILRGATLDINRNEITAIIGKSGGGKSVLVKHIIGLITADSGEIIFDGIPYSTMTRKDFSAIKSRCSYMFQNNALFDSMTVFENIALPLREKFQLSDKEIEEKVRARIEQLELGEVAGMYPKQISGGMQKRVALARALVTEPEIIFFDEPTTGLDPIRKKTVFSMIHRYHEALNFTAVIITHDIPDIFYIAHTVNILDEGRIIYSGSPVSLEQSSDPGLYSYTHGHEMLLDELTGLHNRLALMRKIEAFGAQDSDQLVLATVRLVGMRTIMDYKGELLAHAFISKLAKFVRSFLPQGACAGMFSKEILVLAAGSGDDSTLEMFLRQLAGYFQNLAIETYCHKQRLQVEIGGALITKGASAYSAIQEALATSKKYV
ncbi:MAG: ATP-binding cassette domain-containing protein [Desulfomicrobium sp.]|nr:ATP-binding cassette domain-containing protein [Pseudomonadota bacterium]MBV1713611.1 ATP-binding cassette domain-containing protein [Desulfomicrobium sp.]MBU4572147.1 ATP-binding cassette domain-containing protein [Pseudomonadota bacterium]MBU4594125.1 ATP-binding cassette domain-containing protein [Pseudomonadota bacterium]MBV1720924.1 ATP-binding cassette domain-containing protein [Desulfomicrobium sp.]